MAVCERDRGEEGEKRWKKEKEGERGKKKEREGGRERESQKKSYELVINIHLLGAATEVGGGTETKRKRRRRS